MKRLTKSQYEVIASTINYQWTAVNTPHKPTLVQLARMLAYKFAESDTEFDRTKFLNLCGIKD